MFQICRKLKLLQKPLSELNRNHFAQIDKKEYALKEELAKIQSDLSQFPGDVGLQMAEKDISKQYQTIKKNAFAFLRQKAKISWLREGDENSSIFHNYIRQRHYQNRVLRLQDNFGQSISCQTKIENAFQGYYQELFTRRTHRTPINNEIMQEVRSSS
ncbi:hypothetical protein RIF29_00734 [Crotalaria pallida]|uniref:Uncharacterized protein n=1 Tax=Crotalaria pallida TaxID=3830 RepID=A0AAN9IW06_CROPI